MHYNCIRNEIRQKKIDVLKPQTLVPRNFLGIFSFNQANQPRNISRKLKLEFRGNSDGNYPSDPRFYNHEPLLLPHFSLFFLCASSPSSPAIYPSSPTSSPAISPFFYTNHVRTLTHSLTFYLLGFCVDLIDFY